MEAKQKKLTPKQLNNKISEIYRTNCSGIEIMMMDIPKVFAVARKAHEAGEDMQKAIVDFVNTIRQN